MARRPESELETTPLSAEERAALRAALSPRGRAQVTLVVFRPRGAATVPLADGEALVIGRSAPGLAIRHSSLSRQHARVERIGDDVWVEDLGSKNGTFVNHRPVERGLVAPGDELVLGAISALVVRRPLLELHGCGAEDHDRFCVELAREATRCRLHGRSCALHLARRFDRAPPSQWIEGIAACVGPLDLLALHGPDALAILQPEADAAQAATLSRALAAATPGLQLAVARLPADASSAPELLGLARAALDRLGPRAGIALARRGGLEAPVPLPVEARASGARSLRDALQRFEAEQIRATLEAVGWNRPAAAERLTLPLRTLNHKIRVHGLRSPR